MPMALDHINIWLLEDGDGWTVVDTGLASDDPGGSGRTCSVVSWRDVRSSG